MDAAEPRPKRWKSGLRPDQRICPHCDRVLSYKTYNTHKRLYYNAETNSWNQGRSSDFTKEGSPSLEPVESCTDDQTSANFLAEQEDPPLSDPGSDFPAEEDSDLSDPGSDSEHHNGKPVYNSDQLAQLAVAVHGYH